MCLMAALPALTGAASGIGGTLQAIGTVVSMGGALYQGVQSVNTANANIEAIDKQRQQEAELTAIEDQRTRREYRSKIRQQRAELLKRGVQLDSPTAVMLGEQAAKEMSFASQGVRQRGKATQDELSATQKNLAARAQSDVLSGTLSAADTLMEASPDLWPELYQ